MKLCISTLVCPSWTFQQIIDRCAEYGVAGIDFRGIASEIDITRLSLFTTELAETLKQLSERNLRMPCLNLSTTLITPDPQRWASFMDETQRYAQLARLTRTRYLRIFGGRIPPELSLPQAQEMARDHLQQISRVALENECQIVWETHDDWCTSTEILPVLQHFKPDEVGILWDVEHPFRKGESPEDTVKNLGGYIKHIHLKDSIRVENRSSPRLMGEGHLPIVPCINALKQVGYTGWYALETEKRWRAEAPDPEQSIPQFVNYMKSVGNP